jgi:MFS superfamily sulfate permease-like transporter
MKEKNTFITRHKRDFLSGLIVFLIALPLCLGIAQASQAPLFSGIVAGVIGGVVIGLLSKSNLSVSGPAAGLIAIVLVAIEQLGAFNIFLCAVIVAGAIQLLLGLLKAGSIASFFPSNVIEGMLAGIGLTIIIKETPNALGHSPGGAGLPDAEDGFMLQNVSGILQHIEPAAIIIAVTGILILAVWQSRGFKKLQMIPAGLLVVVVGTLINEGFKIAKPDLAPYTIERQRFLCTIYAARFQRFRQPQCMENRHRHCRSCLH